MERKLSKIWVYLERLSSFLEMAENRHYRCSQPKNAVPFATGSCRKFKPEVLVEWKALLVCESVCCFSEISFRELSLCTQVAMQHLVS